MAYHNCWHSLLGGLDSCTKTTRQLVEVLSVSIVGNQGLAKVALKLTFKASQI